MKNENLCLNLSYYRYDEQNETSKETGSGDLVYVQHMKENQIKINIK